MLGRRVRASKPMSESTHPHLPSEGPLSFVRRAATKVHSSWLKNTYPFGNFGQNVSIHYSCDIGRAGSQYVHLEDNIVIASDVWLNVVFGAEKPSPKIVMRKGCKIGRRTTISAKNFIELREDVLLAPSVLIMDHNHQYSDPDLPIHAQGVTEGGRIVIEQNCWLGYGSVIFCSKGGLSLGRNSIVGANTVVTRSFPPFSMIAGNPGRLVKRYDPRVREWVRVEEAISAARS